MLTKDFFQESDTDINYKLLSGNAFAETSGITISKANKLLRERGMKVSGGRYCLGGGFMFTESDTGGKDTHTALLINIQPIEQADSAEKFVKDWLEQYGEYSYEEMAKRARAILAKGEK